jgi:hypothetical protein
MGCIAERRFPSGGASDLFSATTIARHDAPSQRSLPGLPFFLEVACSPIYKERRPRDPLRRVPGTQGIGLHCGFPDVARGLGKSLVCLLIGLLRGCRKKFKKGENRG